MRLALAIQAGIMYPLALWYVVRGSPVTGKPSFVAATLAAIPVGAITLFVLSAAGVPIEDFAFQWLILVFLGSRCPGSVSRRKKSLLGPERSYRSVWHLSSDWEALG